MLFSFDLWFLLNSAHEISGLGACVVLFDFNHVHLLLHPAATYLTPTHAHITKSPHNGVVTKECWVSSCDELLFIPPQLHMLIFCSYCFDPIEDPLKFHSVIPPSQTGVTPINVNNTPRGGKPTNLCDNDRCRIICRVFHLTNASVLVSNCQPSNWLDW